MDSDKTNNAPTCPSCDVPYTDHLGLNGTCAALRDVRIERDRLRRVLAVERGDEAQASDGWVRHEWWNDWLHGEVSVRQVEVRNRITGAPGPSVWVAYGPGKRIGPQRDTALDCMDAVDAERKGSADDQ